MVLRWPICQQLWLMVLRCTVLGPLSLIFFCKRKTQFIFLGLLIFIILCILLFYFLLSALSVDSVEVDVSLIKQCHGKKFNKDTSDPVTRVSLGKYQVPVNPQPDSAKTDESITVPHHHFCSTNGSSLNSYHISLSVRCPMNGSPIPNGHCTTDLESDTGNNDISLPQVTMTAPYHR